MIQLWKIVLSGAGLVLAGLMTFGVALPLPLLFMFLFGYILAGELQDAV